MRDDTAAGHIDERSVGGVLRMRRGRSEIGQDGYFVGSAVVGFEVDNKLGSVAGCVVGCPDGGASGLSEACTRGAAVALEAGAAVGTSANRPCSTQKWL